MSLDLVFAFWAITKLSVANQSLAVLARSDRGRPIRAREAILCLTLSSYQEASFLAIEPVRAMCDLSPNQTHQSTSLWQIKSQIRVLEFTFARSDGSSC